MNRGIGIAFSLLVLAAAIYAFAPRIPAPIPSNGIAVDSLLLLDATQAGQRFITVGERGHILLSDDAGSTWQQAQSPTQATLTSVYFHDAQIGWAVGHDSVILKTTNGGKVWRQVYNAPEQQKPLLKVWFSDARNGYAIGAYGLFLRTQDGGAAWQAHKIMDADLHLNALAALADGQLIIAGEAGLLLRSKDQGQTWQALTSPYKGSFFGLLTTRDNSLLVYGLRGHVFRSSDAGDSWQAVETGIQDTLLGSYVQPDASVLLAGQNGTVLISHDQGNSFTKQLHPDRKCVTALRPTGENMLLFGESGVKQFANSVLW